MKDANCLDDSILEMILVWRELMDLILTYSRPLST